MAEAPPSSNPPPSTPERSPERNAPPVPAAADTNQQYWCYSCDKRVLVDTEGVDIVCRECKNGFVESITFSSIPQAVVTRDAVDFVDDPSFGSQFLEVLRLIAQASRDGDGQVDADGDAVPPPPPDHSSDDDFLRIELDGWHNDDDEEEDDYEEELEDDIDDDDEEEEEDEVAEEDDQDFQDGEQIEDGAESETDHDANELTNENNENDASVGVGEGQEREEDARRRRRDVLRLRIRDIASRSNSGRNRILDWAEILMGLEDNSIELRVELPETDGYFGNPEDYVDAAGYEALLQNLAESDQSGRRGAPAAAKSAVAELPTVVITDSGCEACAICKDGVSVGDSIKKLPCGHGYHEDCIVPWLGSRNSCPVCRYELQTDDPDYEEERKKRLGANTSGASGSGLI
uniref:RING-type E3 ubiquitin transferase n=1 Tax=Kalanchoe fedtschenkoi TaxID=63787 RepID=A0A7N0VHY7_KALFE